MNQRHHDRDEARRISDYIDSLVFQRRLLESPVDQETAPFGGELRELSRLAALLSGIRLVHPEEVQAEIARRIVNAPAKQRRPTSMFRWATVRQVVTRSRQIAAGFFKAWRPAAVTAIAATVVLLTFDVVSQHTASAAEILTRADAVLDRVVPPGKLLFRRWKIVDQIREYPGAPARLEERYTLEWIDGSDRRRAIGRSYRVDGRMYAAYVGDLDHGQYVRKIYLAPGLSALGVSNERRGLLSVTPSAAEYEAALARFGDADRRVLETYLARGYIYQPLVSERRFNDAMLQEVAGPAPLPRVRLSLDDSDLGGQPDLYKVRSVDAVRIQFRWKSAGPTAVWLERQETVRYIAKDTYLTVKSEERAEDERGRTVNTTRELVQTQTVDEWADGVSPFELVVPDTVPVRHQSAYEHLSQVIDALRRAPAFLARQR
jgi:hypothetical protein